VGCQTSELDDGEDRVGAGTLHTPLRRDQRPARRGNATSGWGESSTAIVGTVLGFLAAVGCRRDMVGIAALVRAAAIDTLQPCAWPRRR